MPVHGPVLTEPVDLGALLYRGLEADPDGLALVSIEERETWRELDPILAPKRFRAELEKE